MGRAFGTGVAKENGEKGSVPRRKSAREGDSQIFVADASAEAGRLLSALQAKGYAVVDVPLGLLPNRVHYEVPELVICDADAHEALRRLTEMLDACSTAPKIFLLGQQDGALKRLPALKALAADLLFRPIDLDWAVRAVQVLVSSPRKGTHRPRILRSSRAPLVVAAARRPYRSDGRPPSSPSSSAEDLEVAWPVDSPPSRGPSPSDAASVGESSRPPRVSNSSAPPSSGRLSLSSDTQAVLEEGKRRVRASAKQAPRPVRLAMAGAAQDLEIPEEFLNALAEPLDDSEMDARAEKRDVSGRTNAGGKTNSGSPTRSGAKPPATGPGSVNDSEPPVPNRPPTLPPSSLAPPLREREEQTNPGGKPPTQPPPQSETSSPFSRLPLDSALPPLDDLSDLLAPVPLRGPQTVPGRPPLATTAMEPLSLDSEPPGLLAATIPPPTRRGQLPEQGDFSALPHHQAVEFEKITERPKRDRIVLPPSTALPLPAPEPEAHGHAFRALAQAIRTRKTGAIAQQDQNGLRRIVLTDGDISTVTSSVEAEGLPQYLHAHGDLSGEALAALGNLPTFGRRSGAALVARGLLQQEDLWPVLRTHAEWILGRALLSDAETQFETKVPARVLEEPAVFGGAAGTEIYLETMRRILTPASALALLGDEHTVLGLGEYESLLSESALSTEEQKEALAVVGRPLGPLKTSAPQLLPILAALSELGILTSGGKSKAKPKPSAAAPSLVASVPAEKLKALSREMDGEAFRARVTRRRALVEDGDYFAILGVSRAATAYEVERARDALISEYADSRLIAATADLLPDLELIRATVEEAYLVLYDDVRRMRYRAALEAIPA